MTGVSLRQLQWWDEQGVVSPVQQGRRRLYSSSEVLLVGIIVSLRRKRLSLQKIRKVLANFESGDALHLLLVPAGPEEVHLLTDGERLVLESSPVAIVEVLKEATKPILSVSVTDVINGLGLTDFSSFRKPIQTETELGGTRVDRRRRVAQAS